MTDKKPKAASKHKIYLDQNSEYAKPVQKPWLWLGILFAIILYSFWQLFIFDEETVGQAKKLEYEKAQQIQKLFMENDQKNKKP